MFCHIVVALMCNSSGSGVIKLFAYAPQVTIQIQNQSIQMAILLNHVTDRMD